MTPNKYYLCVHGHFYQPARGNPFVDAPVVEANAAPFENWNARITAECYQPNVEIGNFEIISFNLGETLAEWLEQYAPETYKGILDADKSSLDQHGTGNALAQTIHHTILPLSSREDKVTQVAWGKAVFEKRYGRTPEGMWLPEMAVDYESLEVLVEQGIEWTILTEEQIKNPVPNAGPHWVNLPNGKRIKVFYRDSFLSNEISFKLGNFGGAGRWAREVLLPRRQRAGTLTLIATDGETFGHHWKGEEQFLHWLLKYEAEAAGYEVTTLARYAREVEPTGNVELIENTAWSCQHNLGRWATGCDCTEGKSFWKGALRRGLDNLRNEVDIIYRREVAGLDGDIDPVVLRDAYIRVVLGNSTPDQLLKDEGVKLKGKAADRLNKLIEAQFYRQKMYTSCAFFFAELDALSTRYGLANAAYVIRLVKDATDIDLADAFRRDLTIAHGHSFEDNNVTVQGVALFDEVYKTV